MSMMDVGYGWKVLRWYTSTKASPIHNLITKLQQLYMNYFIFTYIKYVKE